MAPLPDRFAFFPRHMAVSPVAVIEGTPFTVSKKFEVLVHPLVSVEMTEYVVVVKGEAMTTAESVRFNPVDGDHWNTEPPEAVSTVFFPSQMLLLPLMIRFGLARTVTVTRVESIHPLSPTTV